MSRKPGRFGKHSVRQLFGTGLTSYSARTRFHHLLIEQLEHRTLLNAAPVLTPGESSPAIGTIDEDHAFVVSLTDSFINHDSVTSTTITDEDAGDELGGIAIVGLTGQGTWAYSLDDGATFQAIGTVSESKSLLLPKTAQLRYTPNAQNGEAPTITYRAWDRSGSAEAGTKVDTTTNGDATPFSAATDTATLTVTAVNDAPQNILPSTTPATNEDTELVFTSSNCLQISDVDAGTNAIEVRLNATHGTLKLSATDGVSYVGNESNFVTLTGTVSAINEALKTMVFRPEANFNGSGETGASVEIETDDLGSSGAGEEQVTTNLMRITVNAVNDAPVNDVPASEVTEEDVKVVFSGDSQISISDVDAGDNLIAVTLTATQGKLRLSGSTGLTFSVGDGLDDSTMTFTGKLSDINEALDGLEFYPTSNFSGQATVTLTTNDKGHTGSGELTDTDTVTITITPVNDAPVLDSSGSPTLTEIDDNQTSNTGNTVQQLLASVSSLDLVTDADTSAVEGIAVYAYSASAGSNTATLGKWQYSLTASDGTTGTWLDLPSDVSINSALLLRAQDRLRFVPYQAGSGTATISFRAWDQTGSTSGKQGTKVDAQASVGGSSAFSSATETASIKINTTNSAPVLNASWNPALAAIALNATTNTGTLVKDLIASVGTGKDMITDANSNAAEGLAILSVDNTNGRWQYSTNGTTFVDFTSTTGSVVSLGTVARLLAANDTTRIRFVPNSGFAGQIGAGITFRAWDQTSGTNGGTADTSTNGGSTAFSTATETASISVGQNGSIAGRVFVDANNNGKFDTGEIPLTYVRVTLTRTDTTGDQATRTALTDANGAFLFEDLPAGTYRLSEDQPAGFIDGKHWQDGNTSANTSENDVFKGITVTAGQTLTGFSFGELGLAPQYFSKRLLLSTAPACGTTAWNSMFAEIRAVAEDRAGNSDIADLLRNGPPSTPNTAPTIQSQTFSVAENSAAGTVVGTVAASDSDAGQTLSYAIVGGNTNGAFSIDSSGLLKVANSAALNFETTPSYTLTVRVTDSGSPGLSSEATVVVNLSGVNESPTLDDKTFSVAEHSATGTVVGTLTAANPDAGQTLSYTITAGDTNGVFAINSSGQLTVAKPGLLDYETTPTFTLKIRVTDNGTPNLSDEATITVNLTNGNDPPVVENQSFSINENSSAGTLVGTVAVDSPNEGEQFNYEIVNSNSSLPFQIDSTGQIKVKTGSTLDHETKDRYEFTVKVSDKTDSNLYDTATITVLINNVEETAPVIADKTFTVNEDLAVGADLGTLGATDEDEGQTLTYAITNGGEGLPFEITTNGHLKLKTPLDYETTTSYTFTVQVTDPDNLTDTAVITVNVNDANEAPVIQDQTFGVDVTTASGTVVGTLAASDPDAGAALTYAIVEADEDLPFEIDASGQLKLKADATLDLETASYTFTVEVSDGTLTDTAEITVNVGQTPVIEDQTFTVDENVAGSTVVGTLEASDPDTGAMLTYSIVDGDDLPFEIDANGQLVLKADASIDHEAQGSYTFTVEVSDGTLTDTAEITVTVNDVNETPVIQDQTFGVDVTTASGTVVGTLAVSDPDAGAALTYAIVEADEDLPFEIDASGQLKLKADATLDLETTSYTFTVEVSDGTLTDTAEITVNVGQTPVIEDQMFTVDENIAGGTVVGTLEASDPDTGATLTYSIVDGDDLPFEIDANGQLVLKADASLDHEAQGSYTFTVEVNDGTLTDTAEITVTVNDLNEAPVIEDQTFTIDENVTGSTVVGTLTASDPDAGATLTYSIVDGDDLPFEIDASGQLILKADASLDHEAQGSYTFTVEVSDGTLTDTAEITVTVNDLNEVPVIEDQTFTVDENVTGGTVVGTLTASDPDTGATLTYSIVDGDDLPFEIDANGQLVLKVDASLDHEAQGSYTFTVEVSDGTLTDTAEITVTVNDLNEVPVIEDQTFTVDENVAGSTVVGTLTASDPDAGATLTYSIVDGDDLPFEIDASGQLVLKADASLDHEAQGSYTFTVEVSDDTLTDTAEITVTVNDLNEAPVIEDQTFSVDENVAGSTVVGTLEASDPDTGATLTYSIVDGDDLPFEIDASGQLVLKVDASLDHETQDSYTFTVEVSDGTLTDTAEITVTVNDLNEVPVIEDQTFTVDENVTAGTVVGTLEASDPDAGATLTYSIVDGDDLPFEIDASGQLVLKVDASLDHEAQGSYTFTVEVSDGTLTDTAEITVTVNDINEVPVIEDQTFEVGDGVAGGTVVGTLEASDPDTGATLTYAIQGDTTGLPFAVDANGQVTVAVADLLDYETTQEYTFVVKVTDQDGLSDEATVTVTVNEFANVGSTGGVAFLAASAKAPESVDAAFGEDDSWYEAGWDETL